MDVVIGPLKRDAGEAAASLIDRATEEEGMGDLPQKNGLPRHATARKAAADPACGSHAAPPGRVHSTAVDLQTMVPEALSPFGALSIHKHIFEKHLSRTTILTCRDQGDGCAAGKTAGLDYE